MKTQSIHFTKMHGLGNDFIVINTLNKKVELTPEIITQLADRHIGIGFDQALIIQPSSKADFFCQIFNSDGSEAEQCGNGLRCVARFLHEEQIESRSTFKLETKAGVFPLEIKDYNHIRITLGPPTIRENLVELRLSDRNNMAVSILSLGNPHAIAKVDSVDSIPIQVLAAQISTHSYFPEGVNVGFMEVLNKQHIRLRTYERGAGETLACGSNACAAAVAGIANDWLEPSVKVDFCYGSLTIEWGGENQPIYMTGPASSVYTGEFQYKK